MAIILNEYLVNNNSNLYEYLKEQIKKSAKIDDLENVMTLYFENEDFKGMYFCGNIHIKFGAKRCTDSICNGDISISLYDSGYVENLNYLRKDGYYYIHERRTDGSTPYDIYYKINNGDEYNNLLLSATKVSECEAISFNQDRNYFDYFVKDNNIGYTHMFLNDKYFATALDGPRTNAFLEDQSLENIKKALKDNVVSDYYKDFCYDEEMQNNLKVSAFKFSNLVLSEYKTVIDILKKSISKHPIKCVRAVDLNSNIIVNEMIFKDKSEEKNLEGNFK